MDIPSLSIALSQANVMNQAGTAVLSMALDSTSQETAALIEMMDASVGTPGASAKMMEQSVHPNLGANVDILV
ncbi:MAG: YjfB family protein [Lachnospiraceae bacterium]|nr:YjfB family protein [Lachnospiraceae bacterium]